MHIKTIFIILCSLLTNAALIFSVQKTHANSKIITQNISKLNTFIDNLEKNQKMVEQANQVLQEQGEMAYDNYMKDILFPVYRLQIKSMKNFLATLDTWPSIDTIGKERSRILFNFITTMINIYPLCNLGQKCYNSLINLQSKNKTAFAKDPYAKELFMFLHDFLESFPPDSQNAFGNSLVTFGALGEFIRDPNTGEEYWCSRPIKHLTDANDRRKKIGAPLIDNKNFCKKSGKLIIKIQ